MVMPRYSEKPKIVHPVYNGEPTDEIVFANYKREDK